MSILTNRMQWYKQLAGGLDESWRQGGGLQGEGLSRALAPLAPLALLALLALLATLVSLVALSSLDPLSSLAPLGPLALRLQGGGGERRRPGGGLQGEEGKELQEQPKHRRLQAPPTPHHRLSAAPPGDQQLPPALALPSQPPLALMFLDSLEHRGQSRKPAW